MFYGITVGQHIWLHVKVNTTVYKKHHHGIPSLRISPIPGLILMEGNATSYTVKSVKQFFEAENVEISSSPVLNLIENLLKIPSDYVRARKLILIN